MDEQTWQEELLRERSFGNDGSGGTVRLWFEPGFELPDAELHSNVHLVAFEGDDVVLARAAEWGWMLPGGTFEPGETWRAAAARELAEEAGCRLLEAVPFGWLRSESTFAQPYRPHLPHPVAVQILAVAEVQLAGPPEAASDGETIVEVAHLSVADALDRFVESGKAHEAALLRHAAMVRANTCIGGAAARRSAGALAA